MGELLKYGNTRSGNLSAKNRRDFFIKMFSTN